MRQYSSEDVPVAELFEHYRVTVGMVLVVDMQGVVLVQPAKAGDLQWVLPQGGVNCGESFRQALRREVGEEFPGMLVGNAMPCLGAHINELPPERGKLNKLIVWFGVHVQRMTEQVNVLENNDLTVVYRRDHLETAVCGAREEKRKMILQVVEQAGDIRFLQWNRVRQVA